MSPEPLTLHDLVQLQQALALADLLIEDSTATSSGGGDTPLELLIARFDHVKVQMYREHGPHKRPHFHIEYKRQHRASYAIDTLERIIGFMPKQYERSVLDWARSAQPRLLSCWEQLNRDGQSLDLQVDAPNVQGHL